MASPDNARGRDELRQIRRESRTLYWFVGIFSFFVNMLMLTGPIYMLQVYDRVLGSRSEATLVALSLVVVFLYAMMGLWIIPADASWAAWGRDFNTVWTGGCLRP